MAQFRFSLAKFTTIALCALSFCAHGATEMVPQFGASAYAKITDKPTISSDAITMSVWFKVAEAGAGGDYNCIFGSTGRNNFGGPLTIYHNNLSTASKRGIGFGGKVDGAYKELLYKTELADGAWHFAAATVSGATYTLYLDGEQVATQTYTPGVVAGFGQNLYFGADPGSQLRNFGGCVTEAALWSKALSADEVAALWNGKERLSGNEEGLWGYWPLNEGSGTAVGDASGNNHVGTYQAAVTWTSETTPFILGVPLPTYEPQVGWTGEAQYPVTETADYSVDYGEGDYTTVGTYAFTLTLKNAGAKWADKTTEPKTLPFEIVVAQNEWTEEPSISAVSWKSGETPATVTAAAKYGEVVQTPAAEELAALPIGKYTISVSVPASENYGGLDPVAFTVYVKDPSVEDPGPDDTTATTYTWNSEKAAGLWADPVNSWMPAKSDTVHGFPANSFATATFPAGTYEVTGDENTYPLAALNIDGAVTLKGGAYETAKMTMSGASLVLDGATLRDVSTGQNYFIPTVSNARIELKNGATYEIPTTRIMMKGSGMTFVANDSTVKAFWDMRVAGVTTYMTNSTVNFTSHEMNGENQTLVLKNCNTTLGGFSMAQKNQTFVIDGGTVTLAANKTVSVNAAGQLLELKDVSLDVSGQFNIGYVQAGSVAAADAEVVLDNAEIHQKGNVTRIGSTSVKSVLTFRGATPKYMQEAKQYVQAGTSKGAARPGGADFRFELPAAPYEDAPLQMTATSSSSQFFGNTCLVVDDAGVDRSVASVYPLVYSTEAFSAGASDAGSIEAFFNLIKASATLPFGAELVLSDDHKTISVSLAAIRSVVFLDDDDTILLATQQIVSGSCAIVPELVPFHTGFVFGGWTPDGGVTKYTNAEVAELAITSDTAFVATYKTDAKTAVTDPELATSAAYTGLENKPAIPESEGYTVDWGEGGWTNVGTYTVTLKLSDSERYVWTDGTSDNKTHDFTITQAANAWTTEPTVATSWTVGTTPSSNLGVATFGTASMTPSDLGVLEVGAYTVTFTVAATENYTGLEKTVAVKVRPQGLGPTGDPDTEDAARVYTWKSEDASGYWYDSNRWTANETPAFGYPANAFGSAVFDGANCTVAGEVDDTVYALGGLTVKGSKVTLSGGAYEPNSLTFTGTAPALTLTDGTQVSSTSEITLQYNQDVAIAVTNATLNANFHLYNGATNFRGRFHNATYAGNLLLSHNGTPSSDSNQSFVFSGAESELVFGGNTKFANQGVDMRFERGVGMTFTAASGQYVQVGKNSKLTFAGDNEIKNSGNVSIAIAGSGDNATVFFGAGSTMTDALGLGDFGMNRNASGLTNVRTVISNATIKANNQIYMPHNSRGNKTGCGVTFMGDRPRVTSNTDTYIGRDPLLDGEVLPSWRFVLPATPYEVAPMVVNAKANQLHIVWNTPIEIDVSAVKHRGRYPLFTFANLASAPDVEMLTAAMTAYKVRRVARLDASERVTLGWDEATKTIYADVTDAPGMLLLVR